MCWRARILTPPRHKGISLFILDMETPGIDLRPMVQITGHAEFCEMFLDDVVVPRENMLGERGQGWKIAMHVVAHERGTAAVPRQVTLRTWFDRLVADTRSTIVDDAPLLDDTRAQAALAQALIEIEALGHHASRTMSPFLNGDPVGPGKLDREAPAREGRAKSSARRPSRYWETPAAPASGRSATSTPAPPPSYGGTSRSSARSSPIGSSPFPRTDVELQLTAEQGCSPRAFASCSDEVRRRRART